jgi:hypothetical protein
MRHHDHVTSPSLPAAQAPDAGSAAPHADAPSESGSQVRRPVELAAAAIEIARDAVGAELGLHETVGDYLGAVAEDTVAVSASFASTAAGYRGWIWSVTLAFVEPAAPTVSEVVLLPGDQALLAPDWIPWSERIRPGDLGPGDLLPPLPDDPRLVPSYVESDDPAVEDVAHELGLGRVRVLSRDGRLDLADRWHDGPFGGSSDMAQQAPAHCFTCGFYLPLAGSLGTVAGVCGNEFSPAADRAVDYAYGCGAHSEVVVVLPPLSATSASVVDELRLEVHARPVAADDAAPESVDVSGEQGEGLGEEVEALPAEVLAAPAGTVADFAADPDLAPAGEPEAGIEAAGDVEAAVAIELPTDLPDVVAGTGAGTVADFSTDVTADDTATDAAAGDTAGAVDDTVGADDDATGAEPAGD